MHARPAPLLFALLLVVACEPGAPPEEPGSEEAAPPAQQEEEGLGRDDFVGIERQDVVFNLPWVGGPVNREPTGPPATVSLEDVTTHGGTGFDRIVFHFAEGAFPGYNLAWAEEAPVACESGEAAQLEGERWLRVRLEPASAAGDGAPDAPADLTNVQDVALTCSREDALVWHLGVADSAQVRVMELRRPERLVVDVRHAPGA